MYYYYKEFNKLELHYWLENYSHSMDAIIQNKCEREFLNLISEVAATFGVEILIDTEPLSIGGLKRLYTIVSRIESTKAVITTALIVAIATSVLVTPITTSITKITEIAITKVFEDKEAKKQQNEKTRLEIEKIKQEIKINSIFLNQNNAIEKSRSNFYKHLERSQNVEKVSFILKNEKETKLTDEAFVENFRFKEFKNIRILEEPNPTILEYYKIEEPIAENKDASIEVVSPDFSQKSDNWKGIYNGKSIIFKINSTEFENLVQSGSIQFRKGTTINCLLSIKRKNTRTNIYEILKVNYYLDNKQKNEITEVKKNISTDESGKTE